MWGGVNVTDTSIIVIHYTAFGVFFFATLICLDIIVFSDKIVTYVDLRLVTNFAHDRITGMIYTVAARAAWVSDKSIYMTTYRACISYIIIISGPKHLRLGHVR